MPSSPVHRQIIFHKNPQSLPTIPKTIRNPESPHKHRLRKKPRNRSDLHSHRSPRETNAHFLNFKSSATWNKARPGGKKKRNEETKSKTSSRARYSRRQPRYPQKASQPASLHQLYMYTAGCWLGAKTDARIRAAARGGGTGGPCSRRGVTLSR